MEKLLPALLQLNATHEYKEQLGPITRIMFEAGLLEECEMYARPPFVTFLAFKKNGRILPIFGTHYPINPATGLVIADDKYLTTSLITDLGYPSTHGVAYHSIEKIDAAIAANQIPVPAVVKPSAQTVKGKGVITNIQTIEDVRTNAERLLKKYPGVVIERFLSFQNEYRILVLDGKVIDLVRRVPAFVVGDGRSTISELIEQKNAVRDEKGDPPIRIDEELDEYMKATGITMDSVAPANKHVRLKNVCNYAAGGEIENVQEKVSSSTETMVLNICRTLGLRIAGFDYICNDITKDPSVDNGLIIEVNPNPDIAMHGYHDEQKAIDIGQQIIQSMFRN